MNLTLPYPPSLNRMYRTFRGRVLISAEGRDYKKMVADLCMVSRVKPITGPITISVDAYRPQKRGDLDNLFKGLLDSLNGNCFLDDSQIVEIRARRFDDKTNPRVEVEIKEV